MPSLSRSHHIVVTLFGPLLAASLFAALPDAPTGLVASAGTGVIGLNWNDTTDAATYRIYEAPAAAGPFTLVATRDRSRHLVASAPTGVARHFRVTAVNAALEESAPSTIASATADSLSLDRPATGGHYRIGSSFVTDSDRLNRFLSARSLSVPSFRWQILGAPVEYIWANTLATDSATFATNIGLLQTGGYSALVMNAQRPFEQGERELDGVLLFAEEALAARPDYRVFVHEYWIDDDPVSRTSLWAEAAALSDPAVRARQQRWYWLTSLALAYEATRQLGIPVYVAPIGSAVEAAKAAALRGELEIAVSRGDFQSGDQHLNTLGKYLQEGVVAAGAYQIDVRGTHAWVDSFTTLSAGDATVLQDIIHRTVRATPFSGWHDGAPTTLAATLTAMRRELSVHEGFDDFTAQPGGATVATATNSRSGLVWSYTRATLQDTGTGRADYGPTRLEQRLRLSAGGTLSTTLPRGLTGFSVRLSAASAGTATLRVKANGNVIATFTNSTTSLLGRQVLNVALGGPVTLELANTGSVDVELDDLIWDEPAVSPTGLAILTDNILVFNRGSAVSRQLAASGAAAYAWSVSAGTLPTGLSLSATGLLSGTPTVDGLFTYTLRAVDANNASKSVERTYTTLIALPTTLTAQPQPATASFHGPASFAATATGTQVFYEWYRGPTLLFQGARPSYAILSATAQDVGDYSVRAIGAGGTVTSAAAMLTVLTNGRDSLTTKFERDITGAGGGTFDLTNLGSLPIVLTGELQGNFHSTSNLVVRAYTRAGTANGFATASTGWTLWGTSDAFAGNGYGKPSPYVLKSGGQPATLTIAPGTTVGVYLMIFSGGANLAYSNDGTAYTRGNLRYTPQQGLGGARSGLTYGPFNLSTAGPARVWNGSLAFYEDVSPAAAATPPPTGTVGVAYTHTFSATGGNGALAFALTGGLPAGLVFNAANATLSGRPQAGGGFPLTLTVTDADGDTDTRQFTLVVEDPYARWLADNGLSEEVTPPGEPTGEAAPLRLRHTLGLPATGPVSALLPRLAVQNGAPLFTFTYNTRATGVLVSVQTSTDLATWSDAHRFGPEGVVAIGSVLESRVPAGGGVDTLTVRFPAPAADTPRTFYRLRISPAY